MHGRKPGNAETGGKENNERESELGRHRKQQDTRQKQAGSTTKNFPYRAGRTVIPTNIAPISAPSPSEEAKMPTEKRSTQRIAPDYRQNTGKGKAKCIDDDRNRQNPNYNRLVAGVWNPSTRLANTFGGGPAGRAW